jgi:serine/threonine-protein phosphatase 4 regulatory subunit 2
MTASLPVSLAFGPASDRAESAPATPLFSPIPFLHQDARRSTSRSPPPLALDTTAVSGEGRAAAGAPLMVSAELQGSIEPAGLGLVDELDDPGPGHMSDTPTALTAVTTLPDEKTASSAEGATNDAQAEGSKSNSKPLFGTLQDRFVKGEEPSVAKSQDDMELDADGNSAQKV